MATPACYYVINSVESFDEAWEEFLGANKDDEGVHLVLRITGCVPLATAPDLLSAVRSAKQQLGGKLSIEGLDHLTALSTRAEEAMANQTKLNDILAAAVSCAEPEPTGDPHHTTTWRHTTDMESLQNCLANMDIKAMRLLDEDVHGNIARYEHHRASVGDVEVAVRYKYSPDISDELWGNRSPSSDDGET